MASKCVLAAKTHLEVRYKLGSPAFPLPLWAARSLLARLHFGNASISIPFVAQYSLELNSP